VADLGTGTATVGGGAETNTLIGIENLIGGSGIDTLTGDGNANSLNGGNGGDDILNGGGGDDVLNGGQGLTQDTLNGGAGLDVADYSGAFQRVIVDLNNAVQSQTGNQGIDTFSSIEGVRGGFANDVLTGTDGDNILRGNSGIDILTGGAGADRFEYKSANDGGTVFTDVARATLDTPGSFGDFIFDFQSGTDKLVFDATAFGFDVGALDPSRFKQIDGAYNGLNSGFAGGDPFFVFSVADRTLYYDNDSATPGYSVIADLLDATIKAGDIEIQQLT